MSFKPIDRPKFKEIGITDGYIDKASDGDDWISIGTCKEF